LISLADEQKRQRILSLDEEDKLLAACVDERAHLKAILICALDTGMRQGEIFKLTWGQVDLEHRTITISAFNTKTLQQRSVPVSERLAAELTRLYTTRPHEPAQSVFGISNNVKRSFAQVKDKAGVKGLRFHDLRHSAATRLVQFGLSLPEVGRLLGHSQPATTYRYVNADGNTLEHAKQIMDNLHKPTKQPPAQPTT
jgi:integrase